MALSKALQEFIEQAKEHDTYWVEQAKLDFAQELESRLLGIGMTYSAMAEKIGTSPAYISKVFRGDSNLTIESMVKFARSTGGNLNIQIVDEEADTKQWEEFLTHETQVGRTTPNTETVVRIRDYLNKKNGTVEQEFGFEGLEEKVG